MTIAAEITIKIPNWLERIAVLPLLLYRRIRYGYTFRKITLTKGKYAIVDPQDYDRLTRHKWYASRSGKIWYARRSARCRKTRRRLSILMHREIIKVPSDLVIDHINFNGLDNRSANLRIATHTQNTCHRRKLDKSRASRYKGVFYDKRSDRWTASVKIDRKAFNFGTYREEIHAAKAYDKGARKLHGQFAVLNFPDEKS